MTNEEKVDTPGGLEIKFYFSCALKRSSCVTILFVIARVGNSRAWMVRSWRILSCATTERDRCCASILPRSAGNYQTGKRQVS